MGRAAVTNMKAPFRNLVFAASDEEEEPRDLSEEFKAGLPFAK
jgi:hypothetical protein